MGDCEIVKEMYSIQYIELFYLVFYSEYSSDPWCGVADGLFASVHALPLISCRLMSCQDIIVCWD